jgi:serine/threonine-protein kinase
MDQWIGRYQITETLGKGGMGVVYRARDPELERDVAIKVVLSWAQYDEDAMARFHREARVVAQLQHPHIVTVFDAGRTDDGLPYFVMEYLEGTDLGHVLEQAGALPPLRAVRYVMQVCEGLSYAHDRDIVHRDIKPANLLITPDDHLKVVDFGIAKLVGAQITGSGVSLGTPLYMAPEQVAGRHVDHRADIFAVGGVLYTLLAGRPPFDGPTLGAICHKIETEPPTPLTQLGLELDPSLEAIIRRALDKDPELRYQNAAELADDLRSVASELEAVASAPTVITPKPGVRAVESPARAEAESERKPLRAVALVAVILIAAAVALWAAPGSPLRSDPGAGRQAQEAVGGGDPADLAGGPESTTGPTAGDPVVEGEQPGTAAADSPSAGPTAETEAGADSTMVAGEDATAGETEEEPEAGVPASFYPASQQEIAAVNRIVGVLIRGLEKKDSTLIAQAFGGTLSPRQWRALDRLFDTARIRIRYRLGDVSSSADGLVVAEVHNDILFVGTPGRVPPPRQVTWLLRLQSDQYGRLRLQGLRPR